MSAHTPTEVTFSPPRRSLVLGLLATGFGLGCCGLYLGGLLFARDGDGSVSTLQAMLALAGPLAGWFVLSALWYGVRTVREALTRYVLSPAELVVRRPLGTRRLKWADVEDFALPPAAFPNPPDRLVLHPRKGRSVELPLSLRPTTGLKALLPARFRPLAEHGIERVREPRPRRTPGLPATRWRLHAGALATAYGAGVFLLVMGIAIVSLFRDYGNYRRIAAGHATTEGVVERIEPGGRTDDAVVRYAAAGGRQFRIRRDVPSRFAKAHKPGDRVAVQYLPHEPRVARLRDWELDSRRWVLAVPALPVAYGALLVLTDGLATWVLPLRRNVKWRCAPPAGERGDTSIQVEGAGLQTLQAILPRRHTGALVFKDLRYIHLRGDTWNPAERAKEMTASGIEAEAVAERFVVLSRDAARRLTDRLGGTDTVRGQYFVLDAAGADEAADFAVRRLARDEKETWLAAKTTCRLMCTKDGDAAPLARDEAAAAFERVVELRLDELYGHAPRRARGKRASRACFKSTRRAGRTTYSSTAAGRAHACG